MIAGASSPGGSFGNRAVAHQLRQEESAARKGTTYTVPNDLSDGDAMFNSPILP